jgi:hypothetical protein
VQRYIDRELSDEIGEHRIDIDGATARSPSDLLELATRTVTQHSSTEPFVSHITVKLIDRDVPTSDVAGMEVYDRITVTYRRPWESTDTTETVEVIGIDQTLANDGDWIVTLRTRPA